MVQLAKIIEAGSTGHPNEKKLGTHFTHSILTHIPIQLAMPDSFYIYDGGENNEAFEKDHKLMSLA